ncbi:coiled-coil domain-containing protein 73 [Oncorhynchus kisutch]|uniref:Coiled-coil domain-containing protein 73 n=1 Tax=Oncorhynchus kisutch TaxID=8019 RepID=A0A8C7GJ30_ONCKI|nr:coiled-coil domain-containing protein 73 [Oncorhynchus kisutch]
MDVSADSGKRPTTTGGHDFEKELLLSYTPHETDSGIISLQVLEFKTILHEAVEELHIHREAEIRYEEQISKLVLEKQELEWQKESLQHQIDNMANQHTESLANVKKQFQSKIRGVEGERGKHQLTAELKDKEINSLKEELKLFQLFKYSLEKKLSELEKKLQLQTQTKDSHLKQLGEVEKRFGALSKQCAMVKQAHEKLEQNVEDAMRLNKKLTSVNRKQESTIISLKQEVEELNNKLIKAKVTSVGRSEENCNLTVKEQNIQQLQHRLHVETEMNKKLRDEHTTERNGKKEVMNCLQLAQQLLLTQTQAVSRVELELQAQREEYQALKREHEVIQEKIQEKEDRFTHLLEEYRHCRMIWENEKRTLQERIQSEHQDLRSVKEAYSHLHEQHTELSSRAILQAEHIQGLESGMKDYVKDNENPMVENRDQSARDEYVSKDVFRVDTVVVDEVAQTVESESTQDNLDVTDVSDQSREVGPSRCSETVIDASPQTAHCKVIDSVQTTHGSNPDRSTDVEGGGKSCQGEDKPSSVLQPPAGSLKGLASLQSGSADGLTTVTDVVHVLSICGTGEGQATDSNNKRSSSDFNYPFCSLINNVCSSSNVHLSDKGDSMSGLSGFENSSVYGALNSDPVAGGTRDGEQEQSVYTPEMTTSQTFNKHRGRQKSTSSFQDIDPVQAVTPLAVSQSDPCNFLLQKVIEIHEIRCHTPEANEVNILSESPSSSLPASAQQHSNTHIENPTEQETIGTSCLPSQPLNLPQQINALGVVAQDCAQSDCNIGTKEPEEKHKQPARDCVPVTEDALYPNCQETLPESGDLNVSPDAGTHGDPEQPSSDVSVDVDGPVGSQSQPCPVAMDSPQSERVHEGHCCNSTVEQKLRPQHANDKDIEVKHNNPATSKPPSDETDLSPKSNHSKQSCLLKTEEKTSETIDYSFLASNKRYRSSFELISEKRDIHSRNMHSIVISQTTPTCQISPVSDLKTKLSSGFQEPPSPFTIPIFLKGKQNTRDPSMMTRSADSHNPPSLLTSHKRDHQGEWNTIRETFYEMSAEKESRDHISVSSALHIIMTPSSMGSSRLWQDYPRTVSSPCLSNNSRLWQDLPRTVSSPCHPSFCRGTASEAFPPSSQDDEESQQSNIRAQIAQIEPVLCSARLRLPKKRKMD